MIVKIPMTCSRTGKTSDVELPYEAAGSFSETQQTKLDAAQSLEAFVSQLDAKPDLVVYWKGQLHVLTTVLEPSHDAVSRSLNDVLKKDVYPTAPTRTRRTAEEIAADKAAKAAAAAAAANTAEA